MIIILTKSDLIKRFKNIEMFKVELVNFNITLQSIALADEIVFIHENYEKILKNRYSDLTS